MRERRIIIRLIALVVGWLALASISSGDPRMADGNGPGPLSNHIQYFAYWDDADDRSYNALPEVYQETNLAWIAEQAPGNLNRIIDYHTNMLILSQLYGLKASLSVGYVFFQPGAVLYPDWQTRWAMYANAIEPYASNVVDIYPLDEPYENASVNRLPLSEMRSELWQITAAIRARFPNAKLACVCQPFTIERALDLTMFDWAGFDAYEDPFDPAGAITHDQWLTMLERQLGIPESGRRTLVVPFACVINGQPENPWSADDPIVADRIAQASDYYALAQNHPSVIGIIPFIFNSQSDLFGLDRMPPLRSAYQSIGREITGR